MLQNVICCSCDWYLKSCGPPFFIGQIYAQRHVRINSELLSIETDLVNETTADSHYIHNFIRMGFLSKRVLILKTLIKTEAEDIFFFFFFFQRKIRLGTSCEFSAQQTIHMKCPVLFCLKNIKNECLLLPCCLMLKHLMSLTVNVQKSCLVLHC